MQEEGSIQSTVYKQKQQIQIPDCSQTAAATCDGVVCCIAICFSRFVS